MPTPIDYEQLRELLEHATEHDEGNRVFLDAINDYHNHRTGDNERE